MGVCFVWKYLGRLQPSYAEGALEKSRSHYRVFLAVVQGSVSMLWQHQHPREGLTCHVSISICGMHDWHL
jgi:hypothetical protein